MSEGQSSNVRTGAAIALCIIAVATVIWSASRGNKTTGRSFFFYDMQTGQLFVSDTSEPAPITAPSGGEGVFATVVSCGACDDDASRTTAYLQKWPSDAREHLGKDASQVPADIIMDMVVAKPGTTDWHYLNSPRGQQLIAEAVATLQAKCPSTFTACRP